MGDVDAEEQCFCGLEKHVSELEARLEDRDATIAAYRRRELNQQRDREDTRRSGPCPVVDLEGRDCDGTTAHPGHHWRGVAGGMRTWGE